MMKKRILLITLCILIVIPCFAQSNDDKELARTQEYIAATTKQGAAKISALRAYIQKFPETNQKWTRYAYYSLAVEYFQTKDYGEAVKYGKKTLEIGPPGDGGEEARLYLILGNSYGVKSSPIFNKEEALKYTNKAISFATQKNYPDVVTQAKNLKSKLTGPPPKKLSPEQKIKMHYADGEYAQAVSFYKTLGAAEKSNPEIHKTYANALFKSNRYDSAVTEFGTLYQADKKAIYAVRMADCYVAKAKKDKSAADKAVDYYLEASLLYQKEQNSSNMKASFQKAKFQLYEKYGFNKKATAYEAKVKKARSSAKKNEDQIASLKREIRRQKRHIRRTYDRNNIPTPQYEFDKIKKMQRKIAALESGASPDLTAEGQALQEEKKKIEDELRELVKKAKARLGL